MPRLQLERREGDKSVLERIVNFGTNRIPNTYSIVRIERTKYRVITRSKSSIRIPQTIQIVRKFE